MKSIVLDNSSGVFIAKLGLFRELLKLFSILTTEEINQEIIKGVEEGYRDAKIRLDLISENKIKIANQKTDTEMVQEYKLKKADASIIALAKEKNCLLCTEDKQILNICLSLGIKTTKTTLLIQLLYKQNRFTKSKALHVLDLLEKLGYNKDSILRAKQRLMEV